VLKAQPVGTELFDALSLTPLCRTVLERAAASHKVSVGQAMAKVLEAWAQRQQAAR
jgi:hypothetical protein